MSDETTAPQEELPPDAIDLRLKKEFLTTRQGKTFVLYAGLLDLAHQGGLTSIVTTIQQVPDQENGKVAIVTATASFESDGKSKTFTGIGDAAPNNVAPAIQTALLRMAETRAKARALRDGTNIGVAALEELGNDSDAAGYHNAQRPSAKPPAARPASKAVSKPAPKPTYASLLKEMGNVDIAKEVKRLCKARQLEVPDMVALGRAGCEKWLLEQDAKEAVER